MENPMRHVGEIPGQVIADAGKIEVTPEMVNAGYEAGLPSHPLGNWPNYLAVIYRAMRRLAPTTQIVTPDYVGPERRRRFMAPR